MKAAALAALILLAPGRTGAFALRNLELGQQAPPFSLQDTQGRRHDLERYSGKAVVLCYWRPDQPYSRQALAALLREKARPGREALVFLTIRQGSGPLPSEDPALSVLLDPDRRFYGDYGLFVLPTLLVLDTRHRVKACWGGYREGVEDELSRTLSELLGLAARPERKSPPKETPSPSLGLAERLLENGRPEDALALLRDRSAKSPSSDPETVLLEARALLALNRGAEALRLLSSRGAPRSDSHQALLLGGRALLQEGRYKEAEEKLLSAARLSPEPAQARYYLGQVYEKTGRPKEAAEAYRSALEKLLAR